MQSPFFAGFDWIGLRAGRHVAPFVPPEASAVLTVPLTPDEHMMLRTPTHTAHETAKSTAKQHKINANYLVSTKASRLGEASGYHKAASSVTKREEDSEPESPNPLAYHGIQSIFEHF